MGRETRSQQRSVALTSVDVNLVVRVFADGVDNVFAFEGAVFLKLTVRSKSIGVNGRQLPLAYREKEPYRRFISGFRGDYVSVTRATIDNRENRRFVLLVWSSPTRRQATRARRSVALAAFHPRRDVEFVDINGEIEGSEGPSSVFVKSSTRW